MTVRLLRYIDRLALAINYVSMVTIVVIMGMTVAGIAFRFAGIPLMGLTNLSESMLVMAVYLSVAYAQQKHQHVSVELFVMKMNDRVKSVLATFHPVIGLLICSVILYTSWQYALDSCRIGERMDGAPFYPIYPPKVAIAFGMTCLWLQLLAEFIRGMLALVCRKKAIEEADLVGS